MQKSHFPAGRGACLQVKKETFAGIQHFSYRAMVTLPGQPSLKIGPQSEHVGTSWFLLSILELIRSQREQSINR